MPGLIDLEAIRAEALFASRLQSSDRPAAAEVRGAVTRTLRRLGSRGCAGVVAGEFGDHPDTAVARMTWALRTVRAVYPSRWDNPQARTRIVAREGRHLASIRGGAGWQSSGPGRGRP